MDCSKVPICCERSFRVTAASRYRGVDMTWEAVLMPSGSAAVLWCLVTLLSPPDRMHSMLSDTWPGFVLPNRDAVSSLQLRYGCGCPGDAALAVTRGVPHEVMRETCMWGAGLQQAQAEAYTNRYRNAWGIIAANQQQAGPVLPT